MAIDREIGQNDSREFIVKKVLTLLKKMTPRFLTVLFLRIDRRVDGAVSFFLQHYGKTRFMMAMSKKAQVLGLERLFLKGPKAFIYFFLFYLIRDTILYIIIPVLFAKWTST